MSAPYFNKYVRKGAYHWGDYYGGLRRMNAYTRARYDMVLECVRKVKMPADGRLLEVGCGDGALMGVIHSQLGLPVVGVDTSEEGITLAKSMFESRGLLGEFQLINSYDTGFQSSSFSVVVCSDVIEHVDDPMAMLREIWRVLVPGGRLVITTPIKFSEKPMDPMHVQEWFVGDFVNLCHEVFGRPLLVIQSHPVFWYELISSSNRWVGRTGRLLANLLTKLWQNPFMESSGAWRCYTTQTLVLEKTDSMRSKTVK